MPLIRPQNASMRRSCLSGALAARFSPCSPTLARALQIAVLPVICIGNLVFLHRFFGPWLRRTLHESKRVAELLAQLPKELSVETMVMEAMGLEVRS